MRHYNEIIANFRKKRILVIGDILLDEYVFGSVSRVSPEAPVPIVLQEGQPSYTPGGSANVANNLQSLGARVTLMGKVGADKEGAILLKELKKRKINTTAIMVDRRISTPLKTRIVAQHQQVLRLDRETVCDFSDASLKEKVRRYFKSSIKNFDAVIISDYGKGMITADLVSQVCLSAIQAKKIITVDPKVEHFTYYQGVTAITPNRKETENAIRNIKITHSAGKKLDVEHDRLETDADIKRAGEAIVKYLKLKSLLITLGEQGMVLFEAGKPPIYIDTKAQEVFDVTGAGDTVISVFTLALTAGASQRQAADMANFAAGIVVGKRGAATVTPQELLAAIP